MTYKSCAIILVALSDKCCSISELCDLLDNPKSYTVYNSIRQLRKWGWDISLVSRSSGSIYCMSQWHCREAARLSNSELKRNQISPKGHK